MARSSAELDRVWLKQFPEVDILLDSATIQKRVSELAQQIARDYEGTFPLMVGVLKGSVPFLADLMRAVPFRVACDYVAISSYGTETTSSGVVRLLKDLDTEVVGRHVLVVEDILDTGLTLQYLMGLLQERRPFSLKVCALLQKPDRLKAPITLDYCGFSIPNEFVVGYGLDYAEQYRNLPFIGALRADYAED